MKSTLAVAAEAMGGELHGADQGFDGISIDSRSIRKGELFFALSGPNFDGGEFVSDAAGKGAAGAVVAQPAGDDLPHITVEDTRIALGKLGAAWRDQHALKVVGITGSNGKTTVKELVAACLSRVGSTLATEGNFNNDIGMPLMMLRIDDSHRYVVLEMGANHLGEIAYLVSLAKPDVVCLNNAGDAHLEGFGSVEGIARGKGEILQGDPRPQTAVLNADDEYYDYWMSLVEDIDVLSFGLGENADIRAEQIETGGDRTHFTMQLLDTTIEVTLPLAGEHNVRNACAAAAIVTALDVPAATIKDGLESARPVSGRLTPLQGIHGATLYDDSYNASPISVVAAAEFLASLPGESWFVLGDMFELGDHAHSLHAGVGESIREAGVERLFAHGEMSRLAAEAFGDNARWYDSLEALVDDVKGEIEPGVSVLVKGSRGMRMERVVEALLGNGEG